MTAIGAVDIGGTKLAAGIVDEDGRLLSRMEIPASSAAAYGDGIELITTMLGRVIRDTGLALTAIGIGSTGPVDPMTGCLGDVDFLPRWSGANLVDDLQRRFHVPVALENDADAAALAEASWGAGRNKSRLTSTLVLPGKRSGLGARQVCPEIGTWST